MLSPTIVEGGTGRAEGAVERADPGVQEERAEPSAVVRPVEGVLKQPVEVSFEPAHEGVLLRPRPGHLSPAARPSLLGVLKRLEWSFDAPDAPPSPLAEDLQEATPEISADADQESLVPVARRGPEGQPARAGWGRESDAPEVSRWAGWGGVKGKMGVEWAGPPWTEGLRKYRITKKMMNIYEYKSLLSNIKYCSVIIAQ